MVSGKKGCQLRVGSALTTPKVCELECGTRVRVEATKKVVSGQREIERCEIVLPVKGWASLRLLRLECSDPDGVVEVAEPWPVGSKVGFDGLEGAKELNGKSGSVVEAPEASGPDERYVVSCQGRLLSVRRAKLGFLEFVEDEDVYAYEADAEAAAEAEALFRKMRAWYSTTNTCATGPYPRDAAALQTWTHYGAVRSKYFQHLEAHEAEIQRKRDADAVAERERSEREAKEAAAVPVEAAVPVGGVADGEGPTKRTAFAKGTLVLATAWVGHGCFL